MSQVTELCVTAWHIEKQNNKFIVTAKEGSKTVRLTIGFGQADDFASKVHALTAEEKAFE